MPTKSPYLSVYLGKLKEPWARYCKAHKVTPGTALKEVVGRLLSKESTTSLFKQTSGPDQGKKLRWEVPLTPSEKLAMVKRAEQENCSPRRWVVDLIRLALTHEPQFSTKELEVLGESNYQLYSIGRNLNQLAKRLNEGHLEPVTVERIEELRKVIKAHTETANRAMSASYRRWVIE
jgi:Bacterial mobilisation protein (MobC)